MPRPSRRAIRAIVVVAAVLALLAVGAMLRRNQPLPDTPHAATVQVN